MSTRSSEVAVSIAVSGSRLWTQTSERLSPCEAGLSPVSHHGFAFKKKLNQISRLFSSSWLGTIKTNRRILFCIVPRKTRHSDCVQPSDGKVQAVFRVGLGMQGRGELGKRAEFPGLVAHKYNLKENEACNVFSSYLRTHLKP